MFLPFLFLASLLSGFGSAEPQTPITLAYAPASTYTSASRHPAPIPFSTLAFHADNSSYTLSSFTAPKISSSDEDALVRIGVLPSSSAQKRIDGFAGPSITIAAQSILAEPGSMAIRIALDAELSILSVGISQESIASTAVIGKARDAKKQKPAAWPRLEVSYAAPEPRPVLNHPVVLNEEGKMPAQDKPEPSLFQRYWWVGALVLVFTVMGGGGGEEGGK